jgi:hypothetical protein
MLNIVVELPFEDMERLKQYLTTLNGIIVYSY